MIAGRLRERLVAAGVPFVGNDCVHVREVLVFDHYAVGGRRPALEVFVIANGGCWQTAFCVDQGPDAEQEMLEGLLQKAREKNLVDFAYGEGLNPSLGDCE